MNSISYMGSKASLLDFIERSMNHYIGDTAYNTLYDVFCGSGRVSYHFKDKYRVFSGDKQSVSGVIVRAYLRNNKSLDYYKRWVDYLNGLPLSEWENTDKWFTHTYGGHYNEGCSIREGKPRIWVWENAQKIDIIRTRIDTLLGDGEIDDFDKDVLLLSLVLAVNKVSNAVGHQSGYLKEWASSTQRPLILSVPPLDMNMTDHEMYVGDIFDVLPKVSADIAYVDPPYGSNNPHLSISGTMRYSSHYHLWNTLVENSRPEVWGKANKPLAVKGQTDTLELNDRTYALPEFYRVLSQIQCKVIAISYSNQGLLSPYDFKELLRLCGFSECVVYCCQHKVNTQTHLGRTNGDYSNPHIGKPLVEYLFIAKKTGDVQEMGDVWEIEEDSLKDHVLYENGCLFTEADRQAIEDGSYTPNAISLSDFIGVSE